MSRTGLSFSLGVKASHNAVRDIVAGKRVVLIDDSIVRGTTSKKIVAMLKQSGAKEVHMRISSPPTQGPCYYGIDTPQRRELIASTNTIDEIRAYIEADSLRYLSEEGLLRAANDGAGYCTACFTLDYPIVTSEPQLLREVATLLCCP